MSRAPSSAVRADASHVLLDGPSRRQATLADEARRLSRRRSVALAVAARCRRPFSTASPEVAEVIAARARRRASTLHLRFHRALDALVEAGGFDEALRIVRERQTPIHLHQADGTRRSST